MKTLNGRFRALLIGGAIGVTAFAFGRGAWSADDSPPAADTPSSAPTPQATPPAGMGDQGQPSDQNDNGNNPSPSNADENASPSQPAAKSSLTTESSVTVTSIDRAARRATLKAPGGEKYTVSVPEDVTAFNNLKVGDKIDIDYYQSMALAILPPGTKPSMAQQTARIPGGAQGGGAMGKSLTVSGAVTNVDTESNEVTFKGPHGESKTVKVQDPSLQKKLSSLKQGDVVQFTYTEATAAAIRPASQK